LALRDGSKAFNAATGILSYQVNAPSVYQTLEGVGVGRTVTRGNFLYFKCNTQLSLRLTTDDGVGGSVVSVVPVYGLVVLEIDDAKYLKLLEVLGSGLVEYLVSGQ
jgi:hypothetical protein